MRVLVTGASGFLGRSVVARAVDAGHHVVALVRATADVDALGWAGSNVTVVRGDLRQPQHVEPLGPIDAVIHAAAGTEGDLAAQIASSVVATENLFGLLDLDALERFVHVSTFSVYDFAGAASGSVISDATASIEDEPTRRDAYTSAKLEQEELIRRLCADAGVDLVVARPGAIFGPGKTWAWASAGSVGPFDLIPSPRAEFRLVHVDNCADALVAALVATDAPGATVDLVDDDLPTHIGYHRAAKSAGAEAGIPLPIPWVVVRTAGAVIESFAGLAAGRSPKLPEFASRRRQDARWKPFRYDNSAAKERLGWTPARTMDEAIRATVDAESR